MTTAPLRLAGPLPLEGRRESALPRFDVGRLRRTEPEKQEKPERPCRVLLHNDDVTPLEYVPGLLREVFALGWAKAWWLTARAHVAGTACVTVEPCPRARSHVDRAIGLARRDGHPHLRLTSEPAPE